MVIYNNDRVCDFNWVLLFVVFNFIVGRNMKLVLIDIMVFVIYVVVFVGIVWWVLCEK